MRSEKPFLKWYWVWLLQFWAAITSKCIHGKVQLLAHGKGERAKTAAALVKCAQRTLVISLNGPEL